MHDFQSNKLLGEATMTAAGMAAMSDRAIMRQAGHQLSRVLERYIRVGSLSRENAAAHVGISMWLVTRMA